MARERAGVLITLAALTGCGGGGSGGNPPPSVPPPPANLAPVFGALNFSTAEDNQLSARAAATDPEGASVTISATSSPSNGVLVTLNQANGDFIYLPNSNYYGTETFTVRAVDSAGNASTGTVSVTVTSVNDAPEAEPVTLTTDQNTAISGRVTVTDVEPGAPTITLLTNAAHGAVSNVSDGDFTYTPATGFTGADSFMMRVTDADGATADATVTIHVNGPLLAYSGATDQVTIDDASHVRHAQSAWMGLKLIISMNENPLATTPAPGAVDVTVNGEIAGSVRYTGTLAPDGTGRLEANYSQYRASSMPGVTLNGLVYVDILQQISSTQGRVRLTFRGLTWSAADLNAQLGGWLERQDSGGSLATKAFDITGDVVLHETVGNVQRWFTGIDVQRVRSTQAWRNPNNTNTLVNAWSGDFVAYDSRSGHVAVSFSPSLNFMRPDYPAGSTATDLSRIFGFGSMVVSGATTRKLWLSAVSPDTFAIETNTGTGTAPDRSIAYRWEDNFAAPAGADTHGSVRAVVSSPFNRGWAETGIVFRPEGRFSEHGGGGFVSHQWQLLVAPLGSTASLVDASSTRPSFTADLAGEYLFKLTSTDGASASTAYLGVEATAPGGYPFDFRASGNDRSVDGSRRRLESNDEIALDGRPSYSSYYSYPPSTTPSQRNWRVTRNEIWGAEIESVLFAPNGPVTRFSPTVPGFYRATYSTPDSHANPLTTVSFNVGLVTSAGVAVIGVPDIPFDYDNDGDLDLIGVFPSFGMVASSWRLVRRAADGKLDATLNLGGPNPDDGYSWDHRFEDVTGDGLPDLLRFRNSLVEVSAQQPDGRLAAAVALSTTLCGSAEFVRVLGAVDIDRNGRNDIVRRARCPGPTPYAQLIVNLSNSDGSFAPSTTVNVPDASIPATGAAGDLDGDGSREIVGVPASSSTPNSVIVLRVNGTGGLDASTMTLSAPYGAPGYIFGEHVRIVDINLDGRQDLLVGSGDTFVLTQNPDHSFTERALLAFHPNSQGALTGFRTVDIDGDGRLDLYLQGISRTSGVFVWHRQLADGSFAERTDLNTTIHSLFDYDLDGRADFLEFRAIPPGRGYGSLVNIQASPR
jgi:hypothetical protein